MGASMVEKTRPLSLRLTEVEIDQLTERAARTSGTPTGVARDFIRSGLAQADVEGQANRLLKLDRRLATTSQDIETVTKTCTATAASIKRLEAMFDQLLLALSGQAVKR